MSKHKLIFFPSGNLDLFDFFLYLYLPMYLFIFLNQGEQAKEAIIISQYKV